MSLLSNFTDNKRKMNNNNFLNNGIKQILMPGTNMKAIKRVKLVEMVKISKIKELD